MRVNLTRGEVVFVNQPLALTKRVGNGEAVGVNRGVVHTAADSNATVNIRAAALELWATRPGQDHALAGSKSKADPRKDPTPPVGGICDEPQTNLMAGYN